MSSGPFQKTGAGATTMDVPLMINNVVALAKSGSPMSHATLALEQPGAIQRLASR